MEPTLVIRPIGQELVALLEADILREVYAPGEKLLETEICARFGVSRSPLREAFQILESQGLVERRPRFGTRVTELSVDKLDEISVCRIALEATCSRLLAEHPDHVPIANALKTELDAMRRANDGGDSLAGFEANVRMTELMHGRCGNSVLQKILLQLDKSALRYRFRAYRSGSRLLGQMIDDNAEMIRAIEDGKGAQAARITGALVERASMIIRDEFTKSDT